MHHTDKLPSVRLAGGEMGGVMKFHRWAVFLLASSFLLNTQTAPTPAQSPSDQTSAKQEEAKDRKSVV